MNVKNNENMVLFTKAQYNEELKKSYERGFTDGVQSVTIPFIPAKKQTKSKMKVNGEDKEFRATAAEEGNE